MSNIDQGTPHSRRILFARIAERASEHDVLRAERLLLRGIERAWPESRIQTLLYGLLLKATLERPWTQP